MKFLSVIGSTCGVAFTLITCGTFYTAYSNPSKSVVVSINKFGEANLEFWLMGISALLVLYSFFSVIKSFELRRKKIKLD